MQRGLQAYIKKKKLDPLDSYMPLALEARAQLERVRGIMGEYLQERACRGYAESSTVSAFQQRYRAQHVAP